jgi:uncharacterized membrane protein YccF (DUF307 family)
VRLGCDVLFNTVSYGKRCCGVKFRNSGAVAGFARGPDDRATPNISFEEVEMGAIGNFFWFILGGAFMGLGWWLVGLLAFVSIIGIPWGKACFVIGQFAFFPFGKEAVNRKDLSRQDDIGTGSLGLIGNIVWFLLAGVWLAIGHVISAVACFVTIIGIPFGIQHLKLASIALAPIGKTIVDKELAAAVRGENSQETLSKLRKEI